MVHEVLVWSYIFICYLLITVNFLKLDFGVSLLFKYSLITFNLKFLFNLFDSFLVVKSTMMSVNHLLLTCSNFLQTFIENFSPPFCHYKCTSTITPSTITPPLLPWNYSWSTRNSCRYPAYIPIPIVWNFGQPLCPTLSTYVSSLEDLGLWRVFSSFRDVKRWIVPRS